MRVRVARVHGTPNPKYIYYILGGWGVRGYAAKRHFSVSSNGIVFSNSSANDFA